MRRSGRLAALVAAGALLGGGAGYAAHQATGSAPAPAPVSAPKQAKLDPKVAAKRRALLREIREYGCDCSGATRMRNRLDRGLAKRPPASEWLKPAQAAK